MKIVYFGPEHAGKSSNLRHILERSSPEHRGEFVSLKSRQDHTLYFDFLRLYFGEVRGLVPKLSLFTAPGESSYSASRRLVMLGADGVVFVADSQKDRLRENRRDVRALNTLLSHMGHQPQTFPLVLQCNKQDSDTSLDPSILARSIGMHNIPIVPSIATQGEGVIETLKSMLLLVIEAMEAELPGRLDNLCVTTQAC